MAWPYHILDLTHEQKHERRETLDRYGVYAQLSALIPILGYQLYRLAVWVYSEKQRTKFDYSAIPSSPTSKRERQSSSGAAVRKWRATLWWLEGEVAEGWSERGHWIAAGCWMAWLLFLCVHKTGDDYLHITKRFGVIAASQFPLHYMLSMKSLYSPLALVFKCSHEHLNPWHRLVGQIIYSLLMLHATWYMNFFIQAGIFPMRLFDTIVIIGMVAFCLTTLMVTTSLERVRRWSYRVFFIIHLFIGMGLMPLLFFHAKPLRLYVSEALVLFIFDVTMRKLDTVTGFATITPVPKTKLLKLKIPVPASKMHRFHAAPGQHVYLNIPAESRPSKTAFIHELLYNPFTVAGVSTTDVTLVLRTLDGPTTKQVHNLTRLQKAKPPISIEGPLGSSRNFPNLAANYDRILLVAGGVGASFILPIYRHLRGQLDAEARSRDRLTFTWSMRSAAEASWTLPSSPDSETTLSEDPNIKIFITRSNADDRRHSEEILPQDGSVELDELQAGEEPVKATGGRDRPDLRSIVDESFRAGGEERVAVLVCGPKGMAREVRESVGRWVEKGREVWFHDESFGW